MGMPPGEVTLSRPPGSRPYVRMGLVRSVRLEPDLAAGPPEGGHYSVPKNALRPMQPVEMTSNHGITLARRLFEAFAIQDGDETVLIPDEAGALELSCHDGHRLTPHAQHHAEKFVAQVEVLLVHAI